MMMGMIMLIMILMMMVIMMMMVVMVMMMMVVDTVMMSPMVPIRAKQFWMTVVIVTTAILCLS